jgi:hypothetical protein
MVNYAHGSQPVLIFAFFEQNNPASNATPESLIEFIGQPNHFQKGAVQP